MSVCIIFGGSGFVGTHLAKAFIKEKRFSTIHIADIVPSVLDGTPGVIYTNLDVRVKINLSVETRPDWIFNFAAIHREPGHLANEYFETNLKGAANICEYAERVNCENIFFTSSIAVYGPCTSPTDETKLPNPITPYGGSKYPAELIHQIWVNKDFTKRRLVIARPGVIFGPGDPGNILRMVKAIQKGYFAFPGSPKIHKSYAYIFGFIESIKFVLQRPERVITYNYVETPTETIQVLAEITKNVLKSKAPVISMPTFILLPISKLIQFVAKNKNPIHPIRVKKASTPTHIVPQRLIDWNFKFQFDFKSAITHWMQNNPEDFH